MTDSITSAPEFRPPPITPAIDPPCFVSLSMAEVPIPRLVEMRRALITSLCLIEDMLSLPPEKRAIRTRAERRIIEGEGGVE